jgi:lipid-A-disaccharide synthase
VKIFIVAGEPSGDFHAAELIHALREARPDGEFYSAGGRELNACTIQIQDMTEIAVTGFLEVVSFLPKILAISSHLKKEIDRIDPDIVIFTDFPDFNFALAKKVAKPGRKLVYFISPQLWAWRKGRIRIVKTLIDKMLVIFPFEAEFYRKQKVRATFVGNPLVNTIRKYKSDHLKPKTNGIPRILLLPGSRSKEIRMNLETMCQAKGLIEKKCQATFAVLKHRDLDMALFKPAIDSEISIIEGNPFDEFDITDLAIACSGTVTVELALSGVPSIVMYKMAPVTYFMAKAMVKVSAISMPNIILGHHVYPELIQDDANPENIAQHALSFLLNPEKVRETRKDLKRLYNLLRPFDPRLAASEVLSA